MIFDQKSVLEFFESTYGVKFIDIETQRPVLELIAESEQARYNPYDDPEYKSDYDLFLEESQGAD